MAFDLTHVLIGAALLAAGLLIIYSGLREEKRKRDDHDVNISGACWIGAVQGLCLPFRGFSRSGATISKSGAMSRS